MVVSPFRVRPPVLLLPGRADRSIRKRITFLAAGGLGENVSDAPVLREDGAASLSCGSWRHAEMRAFLTLAPEMVARVRDEGGVTLTFELPSGERSELRLRSASAP